ncbi:MAG: DNA repair protein RecO [Clostridiaceae bacterium]|jgi:DNA repair protein RecO (recombination protein O)|nr:DNA repair protein RecO [Clostridiaceae bacterium]
MKNFVTDAINLKSYNLSDSDKIIVMYSKDKGIIRGVAKGVKKPKSKLGARMDLLVANKLMLYKGKNLDTICQAEALNMFNKTRYDMDKIFYSMYISEIVNNFGIEDDPCANETFDLLYKGLDTISKSINKTEIIITALKFQLKMMQISGFGIELSHCLVCGKPIEHENMYFSAQKGGVVCEKCSDNIGMKTHLDFRIRDFLNALQFTDFDKKSNYETKATEKVALVCFNMLKDYINLHSSKKFKTVEMLQEVS